MMTVFDEALGIGLDPRDMGILQMGLRAIIVYLATVLTIRLGRKRFRGRATAFDVVLGIMIGSVASRAITGDTAILPAIVATAVLVAMHWLLSTITFRWTLVDDFLRGKPVPLVRDGQIVEDNLREAHLSEDDLRAELRCRGIRDLRDVGLASLEGSGSISVLKTTSKTRVVEIPITGGIHVVRVEISQ